MMHRPVYRQDKNWVQDMITCTVHLENGDEIGLTGRQKVMIRALKMCAPPRQKECLYLYYGRGLSQREIAKLLGVSVATVSRRIKSGEIHVQRALDVAEPEEKVRCEK